MHRALAVCLALLQAPCTYYVIHPPTTLEGLLPYWTDEEKEHGELYSNWLEVTELEGGAQGF